MTKFALSNRSRIAGAMALLSVTGHGCAPAGEAGIDGKIRRTTDDIPALHVLSASFSNEPPLIEWVSPRYVDVNYQIQVCYLNDRNECDPASALDLLDIECEEREPCRLTWGNGDPGDNVGFRRDNDFWGDQKIQLHDGCSQALVASSRSYIIRIRAYSLDGTAGPWTVATSGTPEPWFTCGLDGHS